MNRRGFLAALAAALASWLTKPQARLTKPPAQVSNAGTTSVDSTGVSIRVIRRWDEYLGYVTRMDVLPLNRWVYVSLPIVHPDGSFEYVRVRG